MVSDSEEDDDQPKSKARKAVLSDDEEAGPSEKRPEIEGISAEQQPTTEVVPDVSDDSDDEGVRNDGGYTMKEIYSMTQLLI